MNSSPPTYEAFSSDRRAFLHRSGCLVVGFSLLGASACSGNAQDNGTSGVTDPSSKAAPDSDQINAWLRMHEDGTVTVLTGKIAIGQGILVALRQIAAEELDVPLERVDIIMADTGQTANESYTAGSASVEGSGRAIRRAAATARRILLERAADAWDTDPAELTVTNGRISTKGAGQSVTYGSVLAGEQLTTNVDADAPQRDPLT